MTQNYEETPEHTFSLCEDFFLAWKIELAEHLFAADHAFQDSATPDVPRGPEGVVLLVNSYRSIFPDLRLTIEDRIISNNMVAARWTARGTHLAAFGNLEPTGRLIQVPGMSMMRIVDGRITEKWNNWNVLGLLLQLQGDTESGPFFGN